MEEGNCALKTAGQLLWQVNRSPRTTAFVVAAVCRLWFSERAGRVAAEADEAAPLNPPIASARLRGAATNKRSAMTAPYKISASEVRKSLPNDDRPLRLPVRLFPRSIGKCNALAIAARRTTGGCGLRSFTSLFYHQFVVVRRRLKWRSNVLRLSIVVAFAAAHGGRRAGGRR